VLSVTIDNITNIDYTFCKNCQQVHGDSCLECDSKSCQKCDGAFYLNDGICQDCDTRPGCKSCDQVGCVECEDGYYLNTTSGSCVKCSTGSLGGECSTCFLDDNSILKCSKCTNETHYSLDKVDGVCKYNCLPGMVHTDAVKFDQCKCENSLYVTNEGCKSCS
jgi:hypothetical protein